MGDFLLGLLARLRGWRDRVALTREGLLWFVIASGLLLVGLLKGINLITLLASLLVVMILWNGWVARRLVRRLSVRRRHDEPAFAQMPHHWTIRVDNPGWRSVGGFRVVDGQGTVAQSWFVTEVQCRSFLELHAQAIFPRRGRFDPRALAVESGHPLGLVRMGAALDPGPPLVVFPRLGQLHRAQLRRFLSRRSPTVGQARGLPCHTPTAQAEFHGLRTYRPGDSFRHMHWRTTARRGELMVREYEDWPNDDLTVVLEAARAPGDDADPLLEHAISLAATICWEWCRQTGDRLTLAVAGATVTVQYGVTGQELACALLARLALEPGARAIEAEDVAAKLHRCHLSPGPILVLSPRASDLGSRLQLTLRRRTSVASVESGDTAGFFEF